MKPFRPPTAHVTRAILVVCVAIQAIAFLLGTAFDQSLALNAGLVPARITGAVEPLPGALPPLVTLVTHQFLHGGVVHLLMNMVFLAFVGKHVEWLLRPARFLALYLAGGIVGGLLQVAMNPSSVVPVVGASGAISAVFATYALLFAQSGEAPARLGRIRISGETVRALRYAALWIGLQLLMAVAFNMPGMGGVAIWAHIGGFVFGLLFGLPWVRNRTEQDFR